MVLCRYEYAFMYNKITSLRLSSGRRWTDFRPHARLQDSNSNFAGFCCKRLLCNMMASQTPRVSYVSHHEADTVLCTTICDLDVAFFAQN